MKQIYKQPKDRKPINTTGLHALFFKAPKEVVNDPMAMEIIVKNEWKRTKEKRAFYRVFFVSLQSGLHGNDFICNYETVIIKYNVFKTMRILPRVGRLRG